MAILRGLKPLTLMQIAMQLLNPAHWFASTVPIDRLPKTTLEAVPKMAWLYLLESI